jgi:hypothetical protein
MNTSSPLSSTKWRCIHFEEGPELLILALGINAPEAEMKLITVLAIASLQRGLECLGEGKDAEMGVLVHSSQRPRPRDGV